MAPTFISSTASRALRPASGVGRAAGEAEFRGEQRSHGTVGNSADIPRMPGDGHVRPVKVAKLGHLGLARKLFFRRAAVVAYRTAFSFGGKGFLDGTGRQHAVHAQEIVAAAMSGLALTERLLGGGNGLRQTAQRVVLAEDAYHSPRPPIQP